MKTCTAVNCRCEGDCPSVIHCDRSASHEYELRPGHWVPVCADAARKLMRPSVPADSLRVIGR